MNPPNVWTLPRVACFEDRLYRLNTDFRDVLEIIGWLNGTQGAELTQEERWYVAMRLFYRDFPSMPKQDYPAATEYLGQFLCGGKAPAAPAPRLMDWQQDAAMIAAGVNRAAGRDVRELKYFHWWSFLACFDAMGEGSFSTVVGIRDKLHRGKRLEDWEMEFYRSHRAQVDLRPMEQETEAERAEKARLLAMLA